MPNTSKQEQIAERVVLQPRFRMRVVIKGPRRELPLYALNSLLKIGGTEPTEAGDILRQPLKDLCADGVVEFILTARERQIVLTWRDNLKAALNMQADHPLILVFDSIDNAVPIPAEVLTLLEMLLAERSYADKLRKPRISAAEQEMMLNWWTDVRGEFHLPDDHPIVLAFGAIERTRPVSVA